MWTVTVNFTGELFTITFFALERSNIRNRCLSKTYNNNYHDCGVPGTSNDISFIKLQTSHTTLKMWIVVSLTEQILLSTACSFEVWCRFMKPLGLGKTRLIQVARL